MTAEKSRRIAKAGEQQTAAYLEEHGYTILERNWRCGRYAELDIIARVQNLVVFVEVKTRTYTLEAGIRQEGFDAVNHGKQRRIIRAARSYLRLLGYDSPARFDVAVVTLRREHRSAEMFTPVDLVYVAGAFFP